jgi:4'-phosphopantetheinyl transferase
MRGLASPSAGPQTLWSVAGLRSLDALSVGRSEILYAFLFLDGELSPRDEALLDDVERARSRRFLIARDRQRFVVSHVSMRVLLARCLSVRPEAIRYNVTSDGKPRLAPELGPLEFSLSHSGGLGLLAVSPHRPVGVDVEQLRDMPDALSIAQQYFAPAEIKALRSVPQDARPLAFLRYWTHKEAVIKATGEGLRRPLDSFELDVTDSMVAIKRFDKLPGDSCGWSLRELTSPTGHVAAGAVASAPGSPPQRWRALKPVASAENEPTL